MERRVTRIGQKYKSNHWYLLAQDTIDLDIFGIIDKKLEISDTVLGDDSMAFEVDEGMLSEVVDLMYVRYAALKEEKRAKSL